MVRPVGLVVSLVLLIGAPARAADWVRIKTTNFTFEGNASEQDLRAVARRLEQFRAVMQLAFPSAKLATPTPVTVIVFRGAGDIKPVAPRYHGKPIDLAGFATTSGMGDSIAICLEYKNEAFTTAYHEYAHQLIGNMLWRPPLWLNEGLAEYYGRFEMSEDGTRAVLGRPLSDSYVQLLRTRLFPVAEILGATESSRIYNVDTGTDRPLFYGESWLLVHYMLHGSPDRKREFEDYIGRLLGGVPADEAFAGAVRHPERLSTELSAYIHQPSLHASGYPFSDRVAGSADTTMMRLTPAEAEAEIGLELVRQHRLEEARKHLDLAASRGPKVGAAQTGLGLVLAGQGKLPEALPLLRKGVELADDDAMAHFALGNAALDCTAPDCQTAQGGPAVAARELQRAVALAPPFPLAMIRLGDAEVASGQFDAASRHIREAVALLPAREDWRLKAGEVSILAKDQANAQRFLGPIAASSPNEPSKAQARSLLGLLAKQRVEDGAPQAAAATPAPAVAPPSQPASESARSIADGVELPPGSRFAPLGEGEHRLGGKLVGIECPSAGTKVVIVRNASGTHRFSGPARLDLRFYGEMADIGHFGCGARFEDQSGFVIYRPAAEGEPPLAAGVEGRLVTIELVSKSN